MNLTELFQNKMKKIEKDYFDKTGDTHGFPVCNISIHGTVEISIKRSDDSVLKKTFITLEDFIDWIKE